MSRMRGIQEIKGRQCNMSFAKLPTQLSVCVQNSPIWGFFLKSPTIIGTMDCADIGSYLLALHRESGGAGVKLGP